MDVGDVLRKIDGIISEPAFMTTCKDFVSKHCDKFTDDLENKLEYTPIHNEYMSSVESHIEEGLARELGPDFDMEAFMDALPEYVASMKEDSAITETIDFLNGFGDFDHFKDMMLVAKRDKLAGDAVLPMDSSATKFSPECEKVIQEAHEFTKQLVDTANSKDWTTVIDKPWVKIERWSKPGNNEFARCTVTLDMEVSQASDMICCFTKERNNWDDFMTDCEVVEEIDGDDDRIVKITFKIPLVPTRTKHSRLIQTPDFPEKGNMTYMYLDWDHESRSLASARESLGTGYVKPHPNDPTKTIYTSTHQVSGGWLPSFLIHWMIATFIPRMMTKNALKFKKYKGIM